MNIYEELREMAQTKQETVENFLLAFQQQLQTAVESKKVYLDRKESGVRNGVIESVLTLMLAGGSLVGTVTYKFNLHIEAVSKNTVIINMFGVSHLNSILQMTINTNENGSIISAVNLIISAIKKEINFEL